MPELPEVEVVRLTLIKHIRNRTITNVKIYWNSIIKQPDIETFKNKLIGQKINDFQRLAKHLIFILDDSVLISHLRMEGKYYFQKINEPINWKHVLLVIELDNEYELRYHDTRRFGTFHLQDISNYQEQLPLKKVGPEPFDKQITPSFLQEKLHNRKRAIKTMLLDQTIMSGLGNIYVDEVLYASKIHPETVSNKIPLDLLAKIIKNSQEILKESIRKKGTTVASYTSSLGISGTYQSLLKVHLRENKVCYSCDNLIVKIKLNGRGTYFCDFCQIKLL